MTDEIKEILPKENAGQFKELLRAVVFGSQQQQVKQMTDQLTRKKILTRGVVDEKILLATLSEFDPDLIFL